MEKFINRTLSLKYLSAISSKPANRSTSLLAIYDASFNEEQLFSIYTIKKEERRLTFDYLIFNAIPTSDVLTGIKALHKVMFGTDDNLVDKMSSKPNLLVIVAMDGKKVMGYKIGYEIDRSTFYSWLGGVDPNYRGRGTASTLMEKQHHYLKEECYKVVQTKTMNRWRHMLVLNINNGFDVIDTYTDKKGLHKIILEKKRLSN